MTPVETEWTDTSLDTLRERLAAPLPLRCQCGCGSEAVRPRRDPVWAERCYRRWLARGKPAVLPPVDEVAAEKGRKGAIARGQRVVSRPSDPPAEPDPERTLEWHRAEAARRLERERGRALAYLAVRGGRDALAPVRVQERVRDREAFDVLVGCRGSVKAATGLLAELEAKRWSAEGAQAA